MKCIFDKIRECYPVGEASLRALAEQLIPCRAPRRHLLVREGVYCRSAWFIEQGMTRSYWLVDGEEITTSFSTEGGIVFSMDELYYGRPSEEFVETLEPSELYEIPLTALRRLFETDLELANWGRVIHQNEYRRLHRTHKERLTLPARERYLAMQRQFPGVCERAQLGYIASYLGVTASTLSRIRAEVARC